METSKRPTVIACAVIRDTDGRILLQRRESPGIPTWHEKWEFPGGKIEYGETPEETVIRECQEEIGCVVTPERLVPLVWSNVWKDVESLPHVIVLSYVCRITSGKPTLTDDKSVGAIEWFSKEQLGVLSLLPGVIDIIEASKS
jgi:8-oxo-dGTP diphosphatase